MYVRPNQSQRFVTGGGGWSINLRNQTDVILLDFKKVFDSVPHKCLLTKLDYRGIKGNTRACVQVFITNPSQSVSIYGTHSSSKHVISGVPQGSILGPMLFPLYINDISNNIESSLRLKTI